MYRVDQLRLDVTVVGMQVAELDLALCHAQQLAHPDLHVLVVEGLHLEHLVLGGAAVEAHQVRLEDRLAPFQVEVHDLHPEEEWKN